MLCLSLSLFLVPHVLPVPLLSRLGWVGTAASFGQVASSTIYLIHRTAFFTPSPQLAPTVVAAVASALIPRPLPRRHTLIHPPLETLRPPTLAALRHGEPRRVRGADVAAVRGRGFARARGIRGVVQGGVGERVTVGENGAEVRLAVAAPLFQAAVAEGLVVASLQVAEGESGGGENYRLLGHLEARRLGVVGVLLAPLHLGEADENLHQVFGITEDDLLLVAEAALVAALFVMRWRRAFGMTALLAVYRSVCRPGRARSKATRVAVLTDRDGAGAARSGR